MTREEAATLAARAIVEMTAGAVAESRDLLGRAAVMAQGRAAEADLVAALLVLTEPPPIASFVCWCGDDFLSKEDLNEHWKIVSKWPSGYHVPQPAPRPLSTPTDCA